MPGSGAERLGGRFRAGWVLASAAGMAVASLAARPLSYLAGGAVSGVVGEVLAEAAVGVVAGGGVLGGVALAQWPLLRGAVPWASRWPLAGAAAGAGAAAAGFTALKALTLAGAPTAGVVAALVVGLASFVRAHQLVLHRVVPVAGRLAVACAGSFLLAAVLTTGAAAALGMEGSQIPFGALLGALYGAATLLALERLVFRAA